MHFLKFFLLLLHVCIVCREKGTPALVHVWWPEDNPVEAVLPFHLNQTQVSRFAEPSHCCKTQIVFYCFQLQLAEFMHVGSLDREDHPRTINTVY